MGLEYGLLSLWIGLEAVPTYFMGILSPRRRQKLPSMPDRICSPAPAKTLVGCRWIHRACPQVSSGTIHVNQLVDSQVHVVLSVPRLSTSPMAWTSLWTATIRTCQLLRKGSRPSKSSYPVHRYWSSFLCSLVYLPGSLEQVSYANWQLLDKRRIVCGTYHGTPLRRRW